MSKYKIIEKLIIDVLPNNAESYFLYDYIEKDTYVDILLFVDFKEELFINNCIIKSVIIPITVTEEKWEFYEGRSNTNIPCIYRDTDRPSGEINSTYSPKLRTYLINKLPLIKFLYIKWMFYHSNIDLRALYSNEHIDSSAIDSTLSLEMLLKKICDASRGYKIDHFSRHYNIKVIKTAFTKKTENNFDLQDTYNSPHVKLVNHGNEIGYDIINSLPYLYSELHSFYEKKVNNPNYTKYEGRYLSYVLINTRIHQDREQIDLIVLLALDNNDYKNSEYRVFIIEVKNHNDYIETNEGVMVRYEKDSKIMLHNASKQCKEETVAFLNFINLNKYSYNNKIEKTTGILWFPNCSKKCNKKLDSIYLYHKMRTPIVEDILTCSQNVQNVKFEKAFFEQYISLSQTLNKNSQSYINNMTVRRCTTMFGSNYYKNFNDSESKTPKRLTIKGAPGTGKTYLLLGLAMNALEKNEKPALILSYHNVLVAYINHIINDFDMLWERGAKREVRATTLILWYRTMVQNLSPLIAPIEQFRIIPEKVKYKLLREEILPKVTKSFEVPLELSKYTDVLKEKYSMILIDEAQDCSREEQQFIEKLCEYFPIAISLSTSQKSRVQQKGITPSDWSNFRGVNDPILKKIMRSKTNISKFLLLFKYLYLNSEEDFEINPTQDDGNHITLCGSSDENPDILSEIEKQINKAHSIIKSYNDSVSDHKKTCDSRDILICIPPRESNKGMSSKFKKRSFEFKKIFCENESLSKCSYFMDTEKLKKKYPVNSTLYRVMYYNSCRGSEGWVVILCGIDLYYQELMYHYNGNEKIVLEQILIAISRPVDTLIIHFCDTNHPLYEKLNTILRKIKSGDNLRSSNLFSNQK